MATKRPGLGKSAAVSSVALLSFGPVIVKQVELVATGFVFWRLLIAAVPLAVFFAVSRRRVTLKDLRRSAPGGFVFGINLIIGVLALRRTSALNHMIIMSFQPLAVLMVGVKYFGERPRTSIYFFSLTALGGVALTLFTKDASGVAGLSGNLLSLCGMALFTLYFALSKTARQSLDSPTYQILLILVAWITILPFLLIVEAGIPVPSGNDWWLITAMALIPGTGHFLTNVAHGHASLTLVGLMNLGMTSLAPLYAWWILGEAIGGMQAIGTGIVIISLALIVTTAPQEHPPESVNPNTVDGT